MNEIFTVDPAKNTITLNKEVILKMKENEIAGCFVPVQKIVRHFQKFPDALPGPIVKREGSVAEMSTTQICALINGAYKIP